MSATNGRREERWVLLLSLLTDLLIFLAAMSVASLTRIHTLSSDDFGLLVRDRFVCTALFAAAAFLTGSYQSARLTDRFDGIYFLWTALAATVVVELLLANLLPPEWRVVSRREIVVGGLVAALPLAAWRYRLAAFAARFEALQRFFHVLGGEKEGRRIADAIHKAAEVRADARYISLEALRNKSERRARRDGGTDALGDDAIIVLAGTGRESLIEALEFCEKHCRRTFIYPSLQDTLWFQHRRLLAIAGIPLIEISSRHESAAYAVVKRAADCAVAGLGLLLASPVVAATALAVRFTSPGGIFYTQERMGKGGRVFKLYKFRSMVANAEAQTGPVWARANDARVTPVGRFIRRHRIDEIPQLFNVLKGDMSLIGPRPERPHFHEEFCRDWPLFERRLAVRPGVTSLSHVLGSYSSEPEDRLRYDLVYISSLSFLTDLKILLATIRVVLGAKGAQ